MCLSRSAFVEVKVYERLVKHGVTEAKARGVARKVRRAYEAKTRDLRPARCE